MDFAFRSIPDTGRLKDSDGHVFKENGSEVKKEHYIIDIILTAQMK